MSSTRARGPLCVVHDNAAPVRVRIEFGVSMLVAATHHDSLHEKQVQPTHHVEVAVLPDLIG